MKLNAKALGLSLFIVVGGLLQFTAAQGQSEKNDLRELDFDYDAIDARSLDPVDQFLAIRELVDDFEDLLVRQTQRKPTYVCPYCRRKFLRAAQVCTV
ncbi:hypothetical protein MD484_g5567, partial [Candolleomyces efflorescens]